MPIPALLLPLLFWTGIAALSSWAVSRALPMSSRESLNINAQPARIWELITDVQRLPDWNDYILSAVAPDGIAAGTTLKVRVKHPETKRIKGTVKPVITVFEVQQQLTWSTKILAKWILHITTTIELNPISENQTEVTQSMEFTGVLSPGVPFLARLSKIQETSNQQLKALVESFSAPEST